MPTGQENPLKFSPFSPYVQLAGGLQEALFQIARNRCLSEHEPAGAVPAVAGAAPPVID